MTTYEPLDSKDQLILRLLQEDSRMTAEALSQRAYLSPSQCARRKQRLEEAGYIVGYSVIVDADRVGLQVEAFIQVEMASHSRQNADDFRKLIRKRDEVTSVWTLTGKTDYMLRVFVTDLKALNVFVQDILLTHPAVVRVESQIVMDRLKENAPLPSAETHPVVKEVG
ncbi:DNA-binding Lrp family transcriptional regulator [Rubricella aquisinus]|uniref:DNA-binding Lrp family transcriptional regulator n=1 Tax=Rubricella aquisinus TaxID=2028108 RepID=A0A840WPQ1_9RHOB|nr:Lrp/AsnC family transcriptional regulator [Rubricella aquisinus]MBB5517019.1 DNA-binding Lrp family transcriptional regulator [Rubricella aquisinus]